ncbi:MAG: efflux RND transporter permease subunit [Deltaproteobacteria bacterium]|nr:efflux RND transporter permease subunit [Deltaproteobacteria bacterium]
MMIPELAVRKRTSVVFLSIIIVIFGVVSYVSLPREAEPDVTIPYVFVSTSYPGVAPEDMETAITIPIEKKLKGLEGVKHVNSSSTEGMSSIVIEFTAGTDIDEVLSKTKDKVDLAKPELPGDLEDDPEVFEINLSEMPILVMSLSGDLDLIRLKELAEDLEEDIEAIPGVLEAEVTGGLEREIRIEPFPEKLAYYGLSILRLQTIVAQENQNVSGGAIRMADGRFQLRVPGEFKTPDEILGLVVGLHEGRPIYLKDVARVIDGTKDETGRSRLNGRPAVNLQIKKRSGENIIFITDAIDDLLDRRSASWPQGVSITTVMNTSNDIRRMVEGLENNILTGLGMVILVLFFVMGIRNAVLVSLAIPFSMFLTFIILNALGMTLNMVVLFALTLSLGMLVDNAIVIVENIFRYMEQGVPRLRAAVQATGEVAKPVAASTVTSVAAFFPLLFWPGIMGEFMGHMPLTVIITLLSSLFVALVINPALAAIFLKLPISKDINERQVSPEAIEKAGEAPITIRGPLLNTYKRLLDGALNHRLAVIIISLLLLASMVMIWLYRIGLEKPIQFFPNVEPSAIFVGFDMPEGADLDYSDRIARQIEVAMCQNHQGELPPANADPAECYSTDTTEKRHTLADGTRFTGPIDLANVENIYSKSVTVAGGQGVFEKSPPNHIGVRFHEIEKRVEPSPETIEKIRKRVVKIPGADISIVKEEMGPPTGAPINIEISGDHFTTLGEIARQVKHVLERMPFVQDIRDNYVAGSPTVRVRVDRQRAALMGLSTEIIGTALKVAFNGIKVSTFREGDEEYDITVQLPASGRRMTDLLRELLIPTNEGLVPLSTVAKFDITGGLGQVNRIDHRRVVTVSADVDENHIPAPVVRSQAEKFLSEFTLPSGYRIQFTGEMVDQQEAEAFLTKAFATALFLILMVLVTQFNSLSQPLIIISSVILSLGGVFLGLSVMELPFGIIMTGVGAISLAGVVVNNAIVLIDYTNHLKARGMRTREAIIAAGCTRLRPVILTAVTTILGLLPMVTGISFNFKTFSLITVSESSQMWSPLASAVIFGLALATVLTLVVVPTLYSAVYTSSIATGRGVKWLHKAYWAPYYRITGTRPRSE